jgi:single stranded DNA-binding protein
MTGIECAFCARLGRDAELRMVKGGELPMVSFTAAVDQQHQTEDAPATWVRVVLFGDKAEELAPRLVKGTRIYAEGRLSVDLWQPDDGRAPRVNLQVIANVVQPMGQIGRQRPRATRTAERGQRAWDRSGDAGRAQQAGEAVLAAAGRNSVDAYRNQEPPQGWLDDSAAVIRDLEGRGR